MKKFLTQLFLIFCVAFLATACSSGTSSEPATNGAQTSAPSEELTIKHQLGEVKVQTNPEKVLVFDYGVLDSLDKLGVEVTGVVQGTLPKYLQKHKDSKYQNVGTLQEPDYEKIASMEPDLIVISGRQQAAYAELSKIAPTVYLAVDTTKYMDSFKENMTTLGKIFNKESEVAAELTKIEKAAADVKAKAETNKKNGLIILANEGAISAFGEGSRFGIIHDVLGVPAVDKSVKVGTHGQSITFEYIAEKNPDTLFVVDRGAVVTTATNKTTAKELVENELVKKTKAYQDGKIVYLDASYWYSSGGGLVSVSAMIDEVAKAVN